MSLASASKLYKFLSQNPNEHSYRQIVKLPQVKQPQYFVFFDVKYIISIK